MKFKVQLDGQEKEIEVTREGKRLLVQYDEQTFEAQLIHSDGAHFVLEVEEGGADGFIRRKRIRASGFAESDRRQLWANGRLVSYERLREGAAAAADDAATSLSASIPAVVSEVLVQTGDRVNSGQKLILLESMKMILPIQAPYAGIVRAIHCQTEEAVQPGVQLVEIEQEAGEAEGAAG